MDTRPAYYRYLPFFPALLALLVFANTLGNHYALDDYSVILEHDYVQQGTDGLDEIFTTPYRYGNLKFNDGLYRPLSLAMFAVEIELFDENPFPPHLINVLLYALCGLLLYRLLLTWLGKDKELLVLLTVTLFMVHPLHTEAVANIKGRDEILCFLFFVLSAGFAGKYYQKGSLLHLAGAGLAFVLSFLSKENAVTFAAAIPLALWFFFPLNKQRLAITGGVLVVISGLMILLRNKVLYGVEMEPGPIATLLDNTVVASENGLDRLGMGFFLTGKYAFMSLFPHPLAHDYSYNQLPAQPFFSAWPLLGLAMTGGMLYLAYKGLKSKSVPAFGILFFLGTISIYVNVVLLIGVTFAERLAFTPLLGLCLLFAWAALNLGKWVKLSLPEFFRAHKVPALAIAAVLLAYSAKSMYRNPQWDSSYSLFAADIRKVPHSVKAQYNYATEVKKKAREAATESERKALNDTAVFYLEKALKTYPDYLDAKNNLGTLYIETNRFAQAVPLFTSILQSNPNYTKGYYNLGIAYYFLEQYAQAIPPLENYSSRDPDYPQSRYYLGMSYGFTGNWPRTIEELNTAVQLNPNYWEAHLALGKAYGMSNQPDAALQALERAHALNSNDVEINLSLAINHFNAGRFPQAIPFLEKVLSLDPQHPAAGQILADARARMSEAAQP